jgi:glutaredoxin
MAVQYKIYSKDNCTYCSKAKYLLNSYGRPYQEIKIGEDISLDDFRVLFPDAKTVPQILLDDKYIGGYTQLEAHCKETW